MTLAWNSWCDLKASGGHANQMNNGMTVGVCGLWRLCSCPSCVDSNRRENELKSSTAQGLHFSAKTGCGSIRGRAISWGVDLCGVAMWPVHLVRGFEDVATKVTVVGHHADCDHSTA